MSDLVLEAKQLRKHFRSGSGTLEVLRGVDMAVERGEFLAVMGASGVGKSTLLNLLGLLDTPTSGELLFRVGGRQLDVTAAPERRRARLRNELLGFVFQFFHLLPDLDVLENVLLPTMITRSRWRFRRERKGLVLRATELLERVGIAERIHHNPTKLSGGERQRVAIARALINSPDILMCDEPTGNLDTETSARIHELFRDLNQELGMTVLMVTHDPALARQADRTLTMIDGRFESPTPSPVTA